MNGYVVSVMVRTARDNMYLMTEDMPYEDAAILLDEIEDDMMHNEKAIRLPPHTVISTDSIVSVRIMPASQAKEQRR